MGLSNALNNAYSGLSANTRRADVASNNIANATTPGFVRREAQLSSVALDGVGAGVRVDGVKLAEAAALTADRRIADAESGEKNVLSDAAATTYRLVGQPDDPGALTARYQAFEDSLRLLSDDPSATYLQQSVLDKTEDVIEGFSDIQDGLLTLRSSLDRQIGREVNQLNKLLVEIDDYNKRVTAANVVNGDDVELIAARDNLIDQISSIVPVRVFDSDNGSIQLLTSTGVQLVGGAEPAQFDFTTASALAPDMDLIGGAPGALSGLTLNGNDVTPPTSTALETGSLAALFDARDVQTVEFQTQIDALAQDLVDRFEAVDAGAPGLFTDPLAAPATPGLAGRLTVSAAVDPAQGGELWRLRDGLAATAEGDEGENAHVKLLLGALTVSQAAPAASGVTGQATAFGLVADFSSLVATKSLNADQTAALRASRQDSLSSAEVAATGVDIDFELQELTLIQTAYAANARVMEVVDQLMARLLEI